MNGLQGIVNHLENSLPKQRGGFPMSSELFDLNVMFRDKPGYFLYLLAKLQNGRRARIFNLRLCAE